MSGWFDLPQNSICRRTEVRGKRPGRHCRAPTRSAPSSTSGQGTRWACSTGASCVCSRILDMCASNRTAARTAIRRRKVSCKVGSQCVPQPSYGRCTLVRLLHRSAAVRDHACVPTKLSTDMVVEIRAVPYPIGQRSARSAHVLGACHDLVRVPIKPRPLSTALCCSKLVRPASTDTTAH